jgi:hypothetical protein
LDRDQTNKKRERKISPVRVRVQVITDEVEARW